MYELISICLLIALREYFERYCISIKFETNYLRVVRLIDISDSANLSFATYLEC